MTDRLAPEDVFIADDQTLADLRSLADCDMAMLTLARDINRIEEQLAAHDDAGVDDEQWAQRAESAVRFKKAIRNTVQSMAGVFRRQEAAAMTDARNEMLISEIKEKDPALFAEVVAASKAEHPEFWD